MDTPIYDFVTRYGAQGAVRAHMPGHKGRPVLGCEPRDITEVAGADALYEAAGIIARSEANAAALFDAQAVFYSTEGSSQCIRAMLYLALLHAGAGGERRTVAAARNVHKSFLHACALLDLDIVWLWPEDETYALCRCSVSPAQLRRTLAGLSTPPIAVFFTSPDYLGGEADLTALAAVAHEAGIPLLVDGAHGAYLHFLPEPCAPLDLGADLCCCSAHKTLPVLTGGAYLQVGKNAPTDFAVGGKNALALFGSTSPSYLILQSLDLANRALAEELPARLGQTAERVEKLRRALEDSGWQVEKSDPLRITLSAARSGWDGREVAQLLRRGGVECEYADPDFVVLMLTPDNPEADFRRIENVLRQIPTGAPLARPALHLPQPAVRRTVRAAVFAPQETVAAELSAGRILASPTVSCPPAVAPVVCGEEISPQALEIFRYYSFSTLSVVQE